MFGVAIVNVLPGGFHAFDFSGVIVEKLEESLLEFSRSGARNHASDVHVRVAGTGKTKVNDTYDMVVLIEENVAEVEVAMDELIGFGGFDKGVVGIDVFSVVFVIKFVEKIRKRVFNFARSVFEVNAGKLLDKFSDVVGDSSESSMR